VRVRVRVVPEVVAGFDRALREGRVVVEAPPLAEEHGGHAAGYERVQLLVEGRRGRVVDGEVGVHGFLWNRDILHVGNSGRKRGGSRIDWVSSVVIDRTPSA